MANSLTKLREARRYPQRLRPLQALCIWAQAPGLQILRSQNCMWPASQNPRQKCDPNFIRVSMPPFAEATYYIVLVVILCEVRISCLDCKKTYDLYLVRSSWATPGPCALRAWEFRDRTCGPRRRGHGRSVKAWGSRHVADVARRSGKGDRCLGRRRLRRCHGLAQHCGCGLVLAMLNNGPNPREHIELLHTLTTTVVMWGACLYYESQPIGWAWAF